MSDAALAAITNVISVFASNPSGYPVSSPRNPTVTAV
jgi:hypothetical protein